MYWPGYELLFALTSAGEARSPSQGIALASIKRKIIEKEDKCPVGQQVSLAACWDWNFTAVQITITWMFKRFTCI